MASESSGAVFTAEEAMRKFWILKAWTRMIMG